MVLKLVCLCLALALSKAQLQVKDTTKSLRVRAVRPESPGAESASLQIRCSFDGSRSDLQRVSSVSILDSEINGVEVHDTMATVTPEGTTNALNESVISATGKFETDGDTQAELDVTWVSETDGYCRTYMCVATGWGDGNQMTSVYRTIKVQAVAGSSCSNKKNQDFLINELIGKVKQCCVSSEVTQANAEAWAELAEKVKWFPEIQEAVENNSRDLNALSQLVHHASHGIKSDCAQNNCNGKEDIEALEAKVSDFFDKINARVQECENGLKSQAGTNSEFEQAMIRVLSLNTVKYDVSSLYKGRVYIASRDDPDFDLAQMNDLCKASNGYLVEFDDQEEQTFVAEFVDRLGGDTFATGANDADNEGHFVYYNSQKPVTDVVWEEDEPNNSWGNENCVEVTHDGLNDIRCNRSSKYVCEIPLFSASSL